MSIVIPIISEFNSKGIDRARREFAQLEGAGAKTHYALTKAAVPVIASLGAIATQLGFAVKAAAEDQKSQEQLAIALRNSTGANDEQIASVENSITQMMYQTATADNELRPAYAKLVRATGDVTKAQDLLSLGLDVAAGSGKSLETVSNALSRAATGQFGALQKLGIPLDANAVKTKDLDAITQQLAGSFKGAASANAATFEGKLKTLNIAVGEIQEKVGAKLIPVLSDYATILLDIIKQTEGAEVKTNKWTDAFVTLNKYLNPAAPLIKGLQFFDGIIRGNKKSLGQNERVMANTGAQAWATSLAFSKLSAQTETDTTSTKKSTATKKANTDALAKQKKAADDLAEALKNARDAVTEQFSKALEKANTVLTDAQVKFDDFAKTVSATFTGALNFQDAYDAGLETGTGFLDGLASQVAKIKKFGELTNRLIAGGLSENALSKVLDAGVDAGTAIAEELLSGAGNILTANALVADATTMAEKVGLNAATSFYKAGVDSGKALVAGIQSIIDKYTPLINTLGVTPGGVAGLGAQAGGEMGGLFNGGMDFSQIDWGSILAGVSIDVGGLATLASGGLVSSPTIALIGEGGQPEAVVPLDRMGEFGGGNNVTINVQGGDPNAVVDALRSYMRQNGSVPIRVSTP